MITAFYAGILGVLHISLTSYVVFGRWRYSVSLGDGGEEDMRRRIRAHGNFIEVVPMSLILLYLAEQHLLEQRAPWVHSLGVMIVLGRLLHTIGITRKRSVNKLRQAGMTLNLGALTLLSLGLLYGAGERLFGG